MIGAALTIARVKFVLEIRRREVIFAMLLFLAATIVIVRVALSGDTGAGTRAAAGMLWAAVVFTAVLGLLRTFAAEHEGGVIDALLLAPIDRASIWLGTALAQFGFLTAIELVAVPVWWALFFQGGGPSVGTVVVAGPFEITTLTEPPAGRLVPAAGSWLTTCPAGAASIRPRV